MDLELIIILVAITLLSYIRHAEKQNQETGFFNTPAKRKAGKMFGWALVVVYIVYLFVVYR